MHVVYPCTLFKQLRKSAVFIVHVVYPCTLFKQFIGLTHNLFPKFYGQRFDQAVLVFFCHILYWPKEDQHSFVETLSIKFWKKL